MSLIPGTKYRSASCYVVTLHRDTGLPKGAFWKYYRDAHLTGRGGCGERLSQRNTDLRLPRARDDVSEVEG